MFSQGYRQSLRAALLLTLAALSTAAVGVSNPRPGQEEGEGTTLVPGSKKSATEKETQDPPRAQPATDIHVLSNLVTTPVTVVDRGGEFVYDLGEKDFRIFDNGVPQRIQSFEPPARPLAVVILIQTSGSVAPLLGQLRPLAPVLSDLLLGPQGQAAVLEFSDRIDVAQDFSNSSERLDKTLKDLREGGDPARLNDALARAVSMLQRRPQSERRIVVAFSDGFDAGSETSDQDIIERVASADVTIFGLGFSRTQALLKQKPQAPVPNPLDTNVTRPVPPGTIPTPTNEQNTYGNPGSGNAVIGAADAVVRSAIGTPPLERYAAYSGGVFYSHWKEKALQDQLSNIATEVHSQYELAYVPDTLSQPGFHRIEVRVSRPGARVRTRAGYYYTATKP
jgi:VWFA-related protein